MTIDQLPYLPSRGGRARSVRVGCSTTGRAGEPGPPLMGREAFRCENVVYRPRSEMPFFTASLPNFARRASTALSAAFSRSTLWSARSA